MKRSQLKEIVKEIVKGIVHEITPDSDGMGLGDDKEFSDQSQKQRPFAAEYPASGIKAGSAHPAGAEIFDVTLMLHGNNLSFHTRKGHVEIQLTPEQLRVIKDELYNLRETNLSEMSTSDGAGPYQTPYAFSKKGRKSSKRAVEASKNLGFTVAKDIAEEQK